MKRLVLLVFAVLPLFMVAQTPKKVAVMETTKMTNEVSVMQSQMVRGGLETAVANAPGYEGYDRTSFDAIMREQNFQRSGAVSDAQIKKLGEMAGVQYIIVSEASSEGGEFYVLVKMLDVETGKYGAAYDKLCPASATEIKKACTELGAQLFGSGQRTGELQLPEGRYVGDILDGKPHGQGVMYYKPDNENERTSYNGSWVNGKPEGYGTMIWKDGRKYEGNWKNDKKDGYGTQYYASGRKAYEGNWKDDKVDGYGTFYYEDDGHKYVGDFKAGKIDGYGTFYYANGNKYVGNYKDYKKNGQGTEYYTNGDRREGTWTDGKLNGSATYYFSDGRIEHERYVNGVEQ